ncbi:MAG: Wzz/FepE/Etk N-terminal domain-containing protein [Chloroflexales bacterium]
MEQEIDLRPYLVAVLRHWRMIIICTLALALAGVASSALAKPSQRANADVLVIPATSQITLDPRYQTTYGSSNVSNPTAARQALINLVTSRLVVEQVATTLGEVDTTADTLSQQVKVTSTSDLLQITVSDADPARALKIAEAWGKAYEQVVDDIYSRSQTQADLLTADIAAAQQRYNDAQAALETLLKDGQIVKVQGQIASMTDLLDGTRKAQQQLYSDYLTRIGKLDLLLQDAQTLRDQAGAQATSGFADGFAALLLRARTVSDTAPAFQLSAGDIASAQGSSSALTATLDQMISVLAQRRDQLSAQAAEIAAAIASGGAASSGQDAATLTRYSDQLATLNSTFEQLDAQKTRLTQQRDLARDTLMLLQKKRDEQEVARSSPQIEVRFISANIEPKSSTTGQLVLMGGVAGVIGLVLSIVLALLLDVVIPALRRLSRPESAQPGARSDTLADR